MTSFWREVWAKATDPLLEQELPELLGSWLAGCVGLAVVVLLWEYLGAVALVAYAAGRLFLAVFLWAALR